MKSVTLTGQKIKKDCLGLHSIVTQNKASLNLGVLIKINLLDSPVEEASKAVVVNTLVVVEVVKIGHELVEVPFLNEYIFKKNFHGYLMTTNLTF